MDEDDQVGRIAKALKSGARASECLVFFSAGGASRAVMLAWPSAALSELSTPKGRARFTLELELAAPGWICSVGSAPMGGEKICEATLNFSPHEKPADESMLKLIAQGLGKSVCQRFDQLCGGDSFRSGYELFSGLSESVNSGQWKARRVTKSFEGGSSFADLVAAMEAAACKISLGPEIPDAVESVKKTPRV